MKCTVTGPKHRRQFAMAASFVLLAAAGHAEAAKDSKIYAGSFCQPAAELYADNLGYGAGKGLRNNRGSATYIVCPIVRDVTTNTNGLLDVWITGRRSVTGSEGDFVCTVVASNHHGDNVYGNKAPSNTIGKFGAGTGRVVVKIDGVKKSRKGSGNYSIRCVVPSGANLQEYEVQER